MEQDACKVNQAHGKTGGQDVKKNVMTLCLLQLTALPHKHFPVCRPSCTFVDVHLQDLLLADDLAAAAGFTAVLVADAAALALAALAHAGHLLHHAHPQLVQTHLHACAVARHAHLHRTLAAPPACTEDREEGDDERTECFPLPYCDLFRLMENLLG